MGLTKQMDVSVDCVVFGYDGEVLKVLLIEQKTQHGGALREKHLQMALPGDLVQSEETLNNCAARVLLELTSLKNIFLWGGRRQQRISKLQVKNVCPWGKGSIP